ncbi:MAG: hypothetical protein LBG59_00305 [Candidatus Peribacteria bacterium]|nr:hypothetical protein [Candidatus Peribacteria bacterium]
MMNSFYTPDDPEYDAETEVIMDEVKKEAEQLGYKEMLFKDGKNLYRSGDFERPTLEYMERYKEESMYEELAERLTLRDFEQKFGRMLDFRNNEKDVNQFYTIREMRDSEFENF